MRKGVAVLCMTLCLWVGYFVAHAQSQVSYVKPARYRITADSPKWMPDKVLIRCDGWAEDTASRLILVRFGNGKPPVYRCLRGDEV